MRKILKDEFFFLLLASSSCMYRVICEMTAIGFTMRRPDSMRSQMAALFLVTDSCLSYFICTLCSSYVEIRRLSYPSVKSVSHSCGEKGRVVHKIGFLLYQSIRINSVLPHLSEMDLLEWCHRTTVPLLEV